MLSQVLIGCILVLATVAVHVVGMSIALRWLAAMEIDPRHTSTAARRAAIVGGIVLVMFVATLLESLLWAGTYLALDAIQSFRQSAYFSMVTYTTLGYGDVVLGEEWQLLSSLQAANGVIIFGWTTAVIVVCINELSRTLARISELHGALATTHDSGGDQPPPRAS